MTVVKPHAFEYEGKRSAWCVKAIASLARALNWPQPTLRNDGEHSIVKVVQQTRDELQVERQPVIPTVMKGSNGGLEQANKENEGMTRTIHVKFGNKVRGESTEWPTSCARG